MTIETITFAGHSAVFFEGPKMTVAIDPWLEGNPLCPAAMKEPKKLDLVVLTHGHADHAGDTPRLVKRYGAHVIATWELALLLQGEGVPEHGVTAMNKGGTVDHKGLKVTLTNAFHSSSYDTPKGPVYAGEPCGIVLRDGKRAIYHAGDTCLFSDMQLIGEMYKPEIALLPIGDRFTMGPAEAARAAKLVGCRLAIPIHYKTFDMLTGTAEEFQKECSKLRIEVAVIEPGQPFKV